MDTEWSHTNGNTQDVDNEEEPTISGTREFCLLIYLYDQNIFDLCYCISVVTSLLFSISIIHNNFNST